MVAGGVFQHALRLLLIALAAFALSGCGMANGGLGVVQSSVSQHTSCPEAYYSGPVWAPDGDTIYYSFQRGIGIGSEIRALDTRAGVDRLVATGGKLPQVSPDGAWVLYRNATTLHGDRWDVFLARADGSETRHILDITSGTTAWSPDSQRIVFVDAPDGDANLYLYDLATHASAPLVVSVGSDINPVWSPDGSQIAFASDRQDSRLIYLINADGSAERRLTEFNAVCSRSPHWDDPEAWLPDSSGLAFTRTCDGYRVVQIADMQGKLIDDWSRLRHQSQWPEWSADRSQIVYQLNRNNYYVIRAMNADGSNDRELAVDAWSAHLAPDGKRLVVVSHDPNGLTALYLMDIETGASIPLTSNPGNGVCFH